MKHTTTIQHLALLLLRLGFGGGMLYGHGWGKFMKLTGGGEISFGDPLGMGVHLSFYLAVFAEFLCSALIVAGLFTRLATIPLIITMAVVVFVVHLSHGFGKLELPLLYLIGFLVIAVFGPGRFALDAYRNRI